jgi:hypothetical protein
VTELSIIVEHLNTACCAEDIFGTDPAVSFKKLARACHPDFHPNNPVAEQAFQKLAALKDFADERVRNGEWGKKILLPHCVPLEIGKYRVKRNPVIGDIADVYRGEFKDAIVKAARSHDDNDLLRAEVSALTVLKDIKTPVREGVPELIDQFQIDGLWKREANVLTRYSGFWTAQEVHSVVAVDARTAVWMFKRILSLLTWVHHFGLIHAAILPPHVLFYPDNDGGKIDTRKHTIRLIDWCYSVNFQKRTRLSAWVPAWKDHYAPELLSKTALGPPSDLYMAAYLIRYLCNAVPSGLDKILTRCLDPDPKNRFQKAGEVLDEWIKAATKEFGAPKWHDFNLPTTTTGR